MWYVSIVVKLVITVLPARELDVALSADKRIMWWKDVLNGVKISKLHNSMGVLIEACDSIILM